MKNVTESHRANRNRVHRLQRNLPERSVRIRSPLQNGTRRPIGIIERLFSLHQPGPQNNPARKMGQVTGEAKCT